MAVHPNARIVALAIVAGKKGSAQGRAVAPCGICRQSLLEYERAQDSPITIYCASLSGEVIRVNGISSLLPLSFGREDL
jgi:cytidine deaminase